MNSICIAVCLALLCLSDTNADTINVKGKLTCNGHPFESQSNGLTTIAFKKGSAGVRTSNPKFRTNGWADGVSEQSGPAKLDDRDQEKAWEINELVNEALESGNDGIFLSGEEEFELNTDAAPVFKIYNDCSPTKVCWMRDLPISSINAETPFDLGTIELTKLPANFRVVSCWAYK